MTSLASLKKNNSLDKLTKALKDSKASFTKDDRFWQPEVDKAGNGYAVIRFLNAPAVDGEDATHWVKMWSHAFQGPGGWYIENSLTTIGQDDPVSEYNSLLWNSGNEANKKVASDQKRKLSYISNILVVEDPAHPENNGKVFLYSYGKKIFDKIEEKASPAFKDEEAVNVFDFWNGANFKLKIRKVEGYRNYDKSEFEKASPVAKSDEEIEKLWRASYSLKELVGPAKFKTYEELKARLDKVLGQSATVASAPEKVAEDTAAPAPTTSVAERLAAATRSTAETVTLPEGDGDEDSMKLFERLASD